MKKTYFILLFSLVCTFGFGQTISTIDRANGTGPTATDNISTVTSTGLIRGLGLNYSSTTNLDYTSNRWTVGGDQPTAESNNDYIEWSVTANTTYDIALEKLDIRLRRNAAGPNNWQLFYSLDGFATPGIDYSGVQTLSSLTDTIYNLESPGPVGPPAPSINSGASGTITFRLYAWGSTTQFGFLRVRPFNPWSISAAVSKPGIRLIGTVSTATTNSIESDIVATTTIFPPEENINYESYNATSGLTFINSVPLGEFTIRDGGATSPDADIDPTILTQVEFIIENSENIASLALFDGFLNIGEINSVGSTATFSGLNLIAPDGATKQFFVFATFKSDVTDNEQVQLTINSAYVAPSNSSLFTDSSAGGATTPITGDINRIEVTANQFTFIEQPSDGNQFEVITPYPVIHAVDSNLNHDLDANILGIDILTSPSSSIVPETYDMVNGIAVLDNIIFTNTEVNVSLVANASGMSGTSNTFDINGLLTTIIEQNFDTATGWSYTSDTAFFGSTSDWGSTGYFGEIDLVDASPINNSLFSNQILGENALNDLTDPVNPFAILTFADIDISDVSNVRIDFDWQVVGYTENANDIQYQLVLNGSNTGVWEDVFDGNLDINDDQGRVKISIPDGNSTVGLMVRLRNKQINGYSGFDNFRVVSEFDGLIYTDSGGWRDNIEPDLTTGELDAIVIDGTYDVSGDVELNNLTINSGASTDIGFGESITTNADVVNNGDLELNSISNSYSSLIVKGSIINEVTYNRHVNQFANTGTSTGSNDLISAPVTNASQTFLVLRTANPDIPSGNIGGVPSFLFGPFDNNANAYINYTSADDSSIIASGIGYRTASNTPTGSTFEFVGNVETGSISVPVTVGSGSIFNLIGNPYPSYIDLSDFLFTNNSDFDVINYGVYGYDGDATDGFTVWNKAYSDANLDAKITPGQGFLVASTAGGGTMDFTPSMRRTGTSDDFIAGRSSQNLAHLKLQLSKGNSLYNTDLYFNDNASLGMDFGYDSGMFDETTPSFAIYSHLVENNTGKDLAAQSVSYSDLDNVTIPLGINIAQGEQATISIFENNVPEGTTVILEDNVTNTFTNLLESDYVFTPTTTLTETGRFYIHMSRGVLSTTDNILNGLEIYTNPNPKEIVVKGQLDSNTILKLYDLQGRLVNTQALNAKDTRHSVDVSNLTAGVYVVQLQNNSSNRTQKVIIK